MGLAQGSCRLKTGWFINNLVLLPWLVYNLTHQKLFPPPWSDEVLVCIFMVKIFISLKVGGDTDLGE